jgi:hypothetical protein
MERQRYTRLDFSLMAALFTLALIGGMLMAWFVTERLPHLEDEIAYLFQARTYMRGALWAPVPDKPSPLFTPFVINLDGGKRVGKYSIGWPLLLAVGELFGAGWLVNPILSAATIVLIYMLGRELFDRQVGLIAGLLGLTSPLFLIQAGTYMSHASACLWAALLALSFLRADIAREDGRSARGWAAAGGLSIGMLALTRSLTAVGVVLPYLVVLLVRLIRRPRSLGDLFREYWPMPAVAALLVALQPISLYILTGNPLTNLYLMIWKYDTVGFGPQFGRGGHTVAEGLRTAGLGVKLFASDLFGWDKWSWAPLVLGLIFGLTEVKMARKFWPVLLLAPTVLLIIVHIAYWVGAEIYGPRYYYEGHPGVTILAALGIRNTARWLAERVGRALHWLRETPDRLGASGGLTYRYGIPAYAALAVLIALTVALYLPKRLADWHDVYGINRTAIERLDKLRQTDHVLVLVRGGHWQDYAAFFFYDSPWLDGPIIAAHDNSTTHQRDAMTLFPGREVWFYNSITGVFSKVATPYKAQP